MEEQFQMDKEISHICDACKDNSTATESETKNYRSVFSELFLIECAECLKYFNSGYEVTNKESFEEGCSSTYESPVDKPNESVNCDEGLGTEDIPKESMSEDSQEIPYKCNICSSGFKCGYDLRNHINTHVTKNPSKCVLCQKIFDQISNLKDHLMTHTSGNSYKCKKCFKTFKLERSLKGHMNTHKALNPCPSCSETFARKRELNTHIIRKHLTSNSKPSQM